MVRNPAETPFTASLLTSQTTIASQKATPRMLESLFFNVVTGNFSLNSERKLRGKKLSLGELEKNERYITPWPEKQKD